MLKRKLARFKWTLTDFRSRIFRNQVPKHEGNAQHDLQEYQVYPKGGNLSREFFTASRARSRSGGSRTGSW